MRGLQRTYGPPKRKAEESGPAPTPGPSLAATAPKTVITVPETNGHTRPPPLRRTSKEGSAQALIARLSLASAPPTPTSESSGRDSPKEPSSTDRPSKRQRRVEEANALAGGSTLLSRIGGATSSDDVIMKDVVPLERLEEKPKPPNTLQARIGASANTRQLNALSTPAPKAGPPQTIAPTAGPKPAAMAPVPSAAPSHPPLPPKKPQPQAEPASTAPVNSISILGAASGSAKVAADKPPTPSSSSQPPSNVTTKPLGLSIKGAALAGSTSSPTTRMSGFQKAMAEATKPATSLSSLRAADAPTFKAPPPPPQRQASSLLSRFTDGQAKSESKSERGSSKQNQGHSSLRDRMDLDSATESDSQTTGRRRKGGRR